MAGRRARRLPEKDGPARAPSATLRDLDALVTEVAGLYHGFSALAAEIHREGERSAGRRALLRELARGGPRTVPHMARARPVSRQYVQTLVDGLARDGLVERVPNPAHRRSRLVRLTPAGRRRVARIERREAELLRGLRLPLSRSALRDTAEALRTLRAWLRAPEVRRRARAGSGR